MTAADDPNRPLYHGFLRSAETHPDRPAVDVAGVCVTYRELREAATRLAATIQSHTPEGGPAMTGVFAYRSPAAFAGVLGSLLAGNGYLPLNRGFPPERTRTMLARSECRSIIVDGASEPQLAELLHGIDYPLLIILADRDEPGDLKLRWPAHRFIARKDLDPAAAWRERPKTRDALAYVLFTSGSTGIPKGVMVAQRNVTHFVDAIMDRYRVTCGDRFSQTFDMTFDLSVFDMFVAWEAGACVCCPSQRTMLNPGSFIQEARITVWFSVPSVGVLMKRLGSLGAGHYPNLRLSLFCGEPLPAEIASTWAAAAPNSIVENLYGPTELTIACTIYRWDPASSPAQCEREIVPIGDPIPGMVAMVADANGVEVAPGEEGELLLTGPQVSLGYWRDPEQTAARFVVPAAKQELYYRTGDRVRSSKDDRSMTYLGRLDHQIKVQGHRVELEEVEAVLRAEAGVEVAIALGWPLTSTGAAAIEVFVAGAKADMGLLRDKLKHRLPRYAVPRRIHKIEQWPLNANGKIDRRQLQKHLEELG
ncbi:MAG: amino acid adenylation domain-containing protein [Candidatus Binataceae bacterium]|nr:amino acid adenylation domain-containing protein [Candidatus Binataceae bacterium]